jgi:hypothetical protein
MGIYEHRFFDEDNKDLMILETDEEMSDEEIKMIIDYLQDLTDYNVYHELKNINENDV